MAEILEAGAAPLDTISDHAAELRSLIDRPQPPGKVYAPDAQGPSRMNTVPLPATLLPLTSPSADA